MLEEEYRIIITVLVFSFIKLLNSSAHLVIVFLRLFCKTYIFQYFFFYCMEKLVNKSICGQWIAKWSLRSIQQWLELKLKFPIEFYPIAYKRFFFGQHMPFFFSLHILISFWIMSKANRFSNLTKIWWQKSTNLRVFWLFNLVLAI